MDYYDRYSQFRNDGFIEKPIPFLAIKKENGDIYLEFKKDTMRFDTLSYKYYGDPNYAWLILNANPDFPPYEYLIEDRSQIRIPYPIDSALKRYENSVSKYLKSHHKN